MSSAQQPGPKASPGTTGPSAGGGVLLPLTPDQLQTAFDSSIWYLLSLWPALHVACANNWGGPSTADKKDWFAGAVSDLFTAHPTTDVEDLEEFLLNVMIDEFDCNVDDESEVTVAREILAVKQRLAEERTSEAAKEVELRWRNRGQMKASVQVQNVDQDVDDDGEEWDGIEDEDEEMDQAPQLVAAAPRKEKIEPEVDEDGFTKVVSKKR